MATRERNDEHLDETLRRLLEPNPLTVERLVRRALTEGERSPASERGWPARWPAVTAAAAAIVLLILLVPALRVETPPVDPVAPPTPVRETARLTISNADGVMTVTSTSGSKWILLPGDAS